MNEIILNKKVSIERCIRQIRQYYAVASDSPFALDYLRQDAIAMNLRLMRPTVCGYPSCSASST